ncbi:YhcN/YlaJ family sporulation lipoprotein [Cohnella silvisoli]|uniref:YhcN/YlaJ family sporulation lipoprotein n=1 Tax=Cohnella silvisoli TaxID=2873699 RepID=A0ABV1L2G0_9BACL|nr:YhcN/YlaJ family sporulation lipoprotein [Cohnella silvisoli]MCD9025329.1 YhcN/YlaJ family sporulation lipoprotein [Cohnella silvisoli]
MKKIIIFTVTTLCILVAGCTNNQSYQGNQMRQQTIHNPGTLSQQQITNPRETVDHRIRVADKAAAKITQIKGVRQANVLVTKRNAYVAAMLVNNQQLSHEIENRIAQQVRAVDPNVQNVYVSTNPDFISRVNGYVNKVREGKPVSGFFEEFSEMIQRIFPTPK